MTLRRCVSIALKFLTFYFLPRLTHPFPVIQSHSYTGSREVEFSQRGWRRYKFSIVKQVFFFLISFCYAFS